MIRASGYSLLVMCRKAQTSEANIDTQGYKGRRKKMKNRYSKNKLVELVLDRERNKQKVMTIMLTMLMLKRSMVCDARR